MRENIRKEEYRPKAYPHKLVANVCALLMTRRQRNALDRPEWLDNEIYKLAVR
jgi:hypothetical protein